METETKTRQCVLAPNKVDRSVKDAKPWMTRELIELPKPEPTARVIIANAEVKYTDSDTNLKMERSFDCGKVLVGEPLDELTTEQESKLETVEFDANRLLPIGFNDGARFKEVPLFIANSDKTFQAIRPDIIG